MSELTLTEFLEARLAEDEAQADRWAFEGATLFGETEYESLAARVLAEVEAKRAVVAIHRLADWNVQGYQICETCVSDGDWTVTEMPARLAYPCETLRALASVYRDHPSWQEAWA